MESQADLALTLFLGSPVADTALPLGLWHQYHKNTSPVADLNCIQSVASLFTFGANTLKTCSAGALV